MLEALRRGDDLTRKTAKDGLSIIHATPANIKWLEGKIEGEDTIAENEIWMQLATPIHQADEPITVEEMQSILKIVGDMRRDGVSVQDIIQRMQLDMLDHMFKRNKEFTTFAIANNPRAKVMVMEPPVFRMRNALAMTAELGEYIDVIDFKWWGRGVWETQKEKAGEELIDLLHFIFIAFDDLGWDAHKIYTSYIEKNNKNWQRFKEKEGWGEK